MSNNENLSTKEETIASETRNKLLATIDDAKNFVILTSDGRKCYIEMLLNHLSYLQLEDLCIETRKILENGSSYEDLMTLNKVIMEKTSHLFPLPLTQSLMALITKVRGGHTEEGLINTMKSGELCIAVKNVITPDTVITPTPHFQRGLYPAQGAMLTRMLEIEERESHDISIGARFSFDVGIIAERIGFGKSTVCGALIAEKSELDLEHFKFYQEQIISGERKSGLADLYTDVQLNPDTIKCNLVLCNLKTVKDWESNLRSFTNLSVMKVNSAKSLNEFTTAFNEGRLPQVVIIKDGKIGGKVLIETVAELVGKNLFNRLIVDDYDMLNMDKSISLPCANYYWLVSSTRQFGNHKAYQYKSQSDNNTGPKLERIEGNMIIYDNYTNIKCLDTFYPQHYNIPKLEYSEFYLSSCDMDDESNVEEDLSLINCKDEMISAVEKFLHGDRTHCIAEGLPGKYEDVVMRPKVFDRLLPGNVDSPAPNNTPIKAIFLLDTKDYMEFENIESDFTGVKACRLGKSNINNFKTSEYELGISGTLVGLNMEYITHVIITSLSTTKEAAQFVGRAQRLKRETNLQVLCLKF